MVTKSLPCILISGTGSGSGKTSIAIGIAAALTRSGLRVQSYKVGPDFLDPGYLGAATGRTCYNLDGWMCGKTYVRQLVERSVHDADIILIEGVMGLFDGVSATSLEGSTAEIAAWLGVSVFLVAPARGMSRSFAAQVKGYCEFDKRIKIAGIIANRCGSLRHINVLEEALKDAGLPPLIGGIPNDELPRLDSRHLGLVSVNKSGFSEEKLDALADAVEKNIDIKSLSALVKQNSCIEIGTPVKQYPTHKTFRVAIASDDAFQFLYPDLIDVLHENGGEIIYFSPIHDKNIPEDISALVLCGGYPELFAEELSRNCHMMQAIKELAACGGIVYAECGGLMYLSESIQSLDGSTFPMCGILPGQTRMLSKKKALGYREIVTLEPTFFGPAGTVFRGHEFHYSELFGDLSATSTLSNAFTVCRADGTRIDSWGYHIKNVLASYIHIHLASHPDACRTFADACRNVQKRTINHQGL